MKTIYIRAYKCNILRQNSLTILLLTLILAQAFLKISGQDTRNFSPLITPGSPVGAYSLNSIENVNVFNGNVNVNIPLAIVQGRGEVSLPLFLSLPSTEKTEVGNIYIDDSPDGSGTPGHYVFNAVFSSSRVPPSQNNIQISPGHMSIQFKLWENLGWMTKLIFETSDGTRYELFDTDPNSPFNHSVYHKFKNENGNLAIRPRGRYFSSKDGMDIRFVSDMDVPVYVPVGTTAVGYFDLYGNVNLPNGTVYRIEKNRVVWIEDRNGNRINISYQTNPQDMVLSYVVTDPNGRDTEVSQCNDSNYLCNRVEFQGSDGNTRELRILYGGPESSGAPNFVGFPRTPDNISRFDMTPRKLTLPDGSFFEFFHNTEGLLTRMITPQGAKVDYDYDASTIALEGPGPSTYYEIFTRLTARRLYDGTQLVSKTTFSFPETLTYAPTCLNNGSTSLQITTSGYVHTKNYDPLDNLVSSTKHYFLKPLTQQTAKYAIP